MPKNDNQKSSKEYYLTIDGQKIPVTEDVYRAYKQPVWAERKRQERDKRCLVSKGGNGACRQLVNLLSIQSAC